MKHKVSSGLLIILLMSLSGCGRVVDWGMEIFDQGDDLACLNSAAFAYVRSRTIYDQLETAGMFDVMWLSDQVRTVYADAYARRRGKSDEFKKTFLRRQLEENNHFISFYVLCPFEFPLGEQNSNWQLFLKINNEMYHPVELKTTELEPEYIGFFAKKHSRFKASYILKFDAFNVEGKKILNPGDDLVLVCRSLDKQIELTWHIPEQAQEIVPEQPTESTVEHDTLKEAACTLQ
jgi:hypothetical protein